MYQKPTLQNERIRMWLLSFFFFFNDTATTEIYTLSLHDALPICLVDDGLQAVRLGLHGPDLLARRLLPVVPEDVAERERSEEHTSELQSQSNLVCRLLLEKKKKNTRTSPFFIRARNA